jgi:flagellar hook-associated protein 3 FlgL
MMSRIGSYAANQFVLKNNMNAQARAEELRIQVSSGKKAQAYSKIAPDVRRLEGLEKEHAANAAFLKNMQRAELRLDSMEGAVSGLQELAEDFRSTLISASNAENLKSLDLGRIAARQREEAVALMNTEVEGRYLFGGSVTDQPPVDLSGLNEAAIEAGDYYAGNQQTMTVRTDETATLDYGITAHEASDSGFKDLLKALRIVEDDPQDQDAIQKALGIMAGTSTSDGAIAKLADTRAQIGSSLDLLEGTRSRLEDTQVNVEGALADTENIDFARAMTLLAEQQQTLDASYAVTARLSRTSLLNFL